MNKTLRYIGYIFKDCYKAFPIFFLVVVIMKVIDTIAMIAEPILTADILELAAAKETPKELLIEAIVLYGVCIAWGPIAGVVKKAFYSKENVEGVKYFGNKMFGFSKKIKLEELENPDVLDKFNKADVAVKKNGTQFEFLDNIIAIIGRAVGCMGMMITVGRYSPILIIVGLIGIIPILWTRLYFDRMYTALRRRQSNIRRRCAYLWSLFTGKESIKEMRVMGFEDYLIDKWEHTNTERVEEIRKVRLDVSKKELLGIVIVNMCYSINIAISVYLMIQGKISVGAFAACMVAFSSYHVNIQMLMWNIVNGVHIYHVVEDYYDYFTIPTETDGSLTYKSFEERIVADNVHFRYNGSTHDALSGLSCEIKKGEHVVIVGENGSGKTTFSKLLTGAYLPSAGSVTYDGQKTEELNRRSLYGHISVVSQDFVHYNFTLGENIGISDISRKDDKAMEKLLKEVAGDEFLDKVGGLNKQLGREFGGMELSGGEWQKVAIARGLWKESDIIILDEPTSALDPLVEYDILSKFVEMIKDKTSVIISHRVGICRTADKIIVMKNGRMVECGKHEELLKNGGEYSHIWNEQAKWYA